MPVLPCPHQLPQVLFSKYLVQQHIHFFEMLCYTFTWYFPKAVFLTPRHLNNFSTPPIYTWWCIVSIQESLLSQWRAEWTAMWKLWSVLPIQFQLNERLTINRHIQPWQGDGPTQPFSKPHVCSSHGSSFWSWSFVLFYLDLFKELFPGTQKAYLGPNLRDKNLNYREANF